AGLVGAEQIHRAEVLDRAELLHDDLIFRHRERAFRGALLSVLAHFFEDGRWGSPVQGGVEGQSLTAEDQLFILIQAALNLTAMREAAPEAKICYERAESLCHSLNRPLLLYVALIGQTALLHCH
ncbi:MAG: hypothetical protein WBL39_25355, partial [Terrimicrobiaceae bacterium]